MRPRATDRDHIDRVALELFLAHGYSSVTTDQLIRACGVSRPTFFRYVTSRDSLVLDQIAKFGEGVAVMVRKRVEASAWDALREAMCDAVEMLDPGSREGMAFRILQSSPGIRSSALELTRSWRRQLTESLVAGGYFAGDDRRCEAAAAMAIGLFQMTWASPGATPSSTSALLRLAFDDAVNLVV